MLLVACMGANLSRPCWESRCEDNCRGGCCAAQLPAECSGRAAVAVTKHRQWQNSASLNKLKLHSYRAKTAEELNVSITASTLRQAK